MTATESGPATDPNMVSVLAAVADALATGSPESIGRLMDERVVWHGRQPWQVCSGPRAAMGFMSSGLATPWKIQRLEVETANEDVTLTAWGEGFVDLDEEGEATPRPSATMVFTFRNGKIVHIQGR